MSSPVPLAEPISLTRLLDQAMRLLRQHLRALIVPIGIPLAIVGAAVPLAQLAMNMSLEDSGGEPPMVAFAISMAVFVVSMGVFVLAYVAMMVAGTDAVAGRPVSGGRAWRVALDLRVMGTSILVTLTCILGFAFCILPGIYLGLILTAVVPVMVHEERYGIAAMRRSAALMRFNPGGRIGTDPRLRSFVLGVTATMIGYVVGFFVQIPLMIAMMVFMFREIASGAEVDPNELTNQMMWLQVPSNVIGMVLQGIVYLYMGFGIALIYFDVVRRKEGEDLLAASEDLAGASPPSGP